jgi:hypothetical protein
MLGMRRMGARLKEMFLDHYRYARLIGGSGRAGKDSVTRQTDQ